ncbi:BQ5605_C014g07603 [Microbotryum silenes-dioicae]|uniref:BQ5605_C014g07603 protein n=1 Tax=Microbotryum silenes-dioicae TaxID=796604 RepID=A0A2X0LXZ6_9BASI|nr:BQ5605_C014g07603 [Microbotryum silenes-dioicae]
MVSSLSKEAIDPLPSTSSSPNPGDRPTPARPSEPSLIARLQHEKIRRVSLFGRSVLVLVGELVVNVLLWGVALALFVGDQGRRGILSLCLIAWTLGLRHGLDMDHIVAIDNVTRNLVALGRLPVTVGLFFSIGHSTIVVAATIAGCMLNLVISYISIVIATSAIDKMDNVSAIGGVIGVSISASFLLLLALINSAILFATLREARKRRNVAAAAATISTVDVPETPSKDLEAQPDFRATSPTPPAAPTRLPTTTCLTRLGRPLFALINRPYKMYFIGVLFGLGFDTASEITLLGISALARRQSISSDGSLRAGIKTSEILILPLLFTAGMTLVDSIDNIGMCWGYSWERFREKKRWKWWVREGEEESVELGVLGTADEEGLLRISTVLTILSIVLALLISITEFMGLALEKCTACAQAAETSPNLDGRWWRFWGTANDNSGYLGAGIVALFIVVFASWYFITWGLRKRCQRKHLHSDEDEKTEDIEGVRVTEHVEVPYSSPRL